jgi:hypothetical protein
VIEAARKEEGKEKDKEKKERVKEKKHKKRKMQTSTRVSSLPGVYSSGAPPARRKEHEDAAFAWRGFDSPSRDGPKDITVERTALAPITLILISNATHVSSATDLLKPAQCTVHSLRRTSRRKQSHSYVSAASSRIRSSHHSSMFSVLLEARRSRRCC